MMLMPEPAAVLIASGIQLAPRAPSIDLAVRPGEIVGLAGLEGHGQEAFLETLCGLRRPAAGTVIMQEADSGARGRDQPRAGGHGGHRLSAARPARHRHLPGQSVLDNFAIAASAAPAGRSADRPAQAAAPALLSRFRDRCRWSRRASAADRRRCRAATSRRCCSPAGWRCEPRVLLLNDPTRGVDLGTRLKLYEVFRGLAATKACPWWSCRARSRRCCSSATASWCSASRAWRASWPAQRAGDGRVIAAMFGQEERP